jgi:hypothetical protein
VLKNWKFWLIIAVLSAFLAIWITEGLIWAIATLIIAGGLCIYILQSRKRRRLHDIYIIKEKGEPVEDIYIIGDEESPVREQPRRSAIQTGLDWHVPKVNKDGVEFITGAKGIRKKQEDDMRRILKRLRGE